VDAFCRGGLKSRQDADTKGSVFGVNSKSNFDSKSRTGRPRSMNDEEMEQLVLAYYSYPYSFRQLADMFGVSRMTVWRALQGAEIPNMR